MTFETIDLTKKPLNRVEEWGSLRMNKSFVKGLVSVIMPTYNRAVFLPEAIDSVLDQSYRPIELLIVDDGSTDNTSEVVQAKLDGVKEQAGFSAVYIRQPNRRQCAARNQGLLHSHGEFIQYLDSDDVLVRDKIAQHVAMLSDESLDMVWSSWIVVPSDQVQAQLKEINGRRNPEKGLARLTDELLPWEPWPSLTRRRFVAEHPLWNELCARWDDWEYAVRLLSANPKRAKDDGIRCVQRSHDLGRHHDFESNSAGIGFGLASCNQARAAHSARGSGNPLCKQLVADRYWDVGLEGLLRGKEEQVLEAFQGATAMAPSQVFWAKAAVASLSMKYIGKGFTKLLLSRYLRNR